MTVNKVVYDGTTLVDLTSDTVTADVLQSGYTAHQADGKQITGNVIHASNSNLLDNWYFIDPINQRGRTEYTSGYCIDRYVVEGASGSPHKISLRSSGIVIQPFSAIRQTMENKLKDETIVIFSVIIDSNLYTTTFAINNSLAYTRVLEKGHIVLAYNGSANSLQIYNKSDTITMTVTAAKLELGTHQTLAHKEGEMWVLNDPPPNKALELAKCQRYQLVIKEYTRVPASLENSTNLQFAFPIPVTMCTIPTINTNNLSVQSKSGTNLSGYTFNPLYLSGGILVIQAVKSNITDTNTSLCTINGPVIFDANL